jgi:predicted lipoprotein with Yx(FWY)xxD motif
MKKTFALVTLVAALLPSAACGGTDETNGSAPAAREATAKPTLTVRSTRFGKILFAGNGRVLYAFTRDRRNGPSRCYGDCAAAWPVYFAARPLKAGPGVKQSLLGTVKRRNGRLQVTYNGWPLYFYAHERAGEVKCQNVETHGGTWLVVRPSGRLVR